MSAKKATGAVKVRPLRAEDLDAVTALDQQEVGHSRRGFFEESLAAVRSEPESFIARAVELDGTFKGFLIARITRGEFGIETPFAAIDVLGVDNDARGHGLARALIEDLEAQARKLGVDEMASQTDWEKQSLAGFLGHMGFELAPLMLLERPTDAPIASVDSDS